MSAVETSENPDRRDGCCTDPRGALRRARRADFPTDARSPTSRKSPGGRKCPSDRSRARRNGSSPRRTAAPSQSGVVTDPSSFSSTCRDDCAVCRCGGLRIVRHSVCRSRSIFLRSDSGIGERSTTCRPTAAASTCCGGTKTRRPLKSTSSWGGVRCSIEVAGAKGAPRPGRPLPGPGGGGMRNIF